MAWKSLRVCPQCGDEKLIGCENTYCSLKCAGEARRGRYDGPGHYRWKGDAVSDGTGRGRAGRWYAVTGQCARCDQPATRRQHRDHRPQNNDPENNEFHCGPCHAEHHRKLSAQDELDIRDRYAQGGVSQAALAREYGVSQGTVSYVLRDRPYNRKVAV